jgi:hypothetical protein
MSRVGRNFWAIAGEGLASLLLPIAAIWLPWATYRSTALVVTFKSDRSRLVLVACSVGSLGLVVVLLLWNWASVRGIGQCPWFELFLGRTALIYSLVIAFSRIADANRTVSTDLGYSASSYRIGAGPAIAASVVMVVSSAVHLTSKRMSETASTGRTGA